MTMINNAPLIEVLLNMIRREYERIERSREEIRKCREELAELGWMGPEVRELQAKSQ